MKILKISLLSLFGVVLLLAAISIRPVDDTPYFLTEYYRETIQRLEQKIPDAKKNAVLAAAPLQIGYGQASITPGAGVPLAGFSSRKGKPNQGVRDSLFVKALALRTGKQEVVLVGVDALIFSRTLADSVIQQITPAIGLKREEILFGATHTHAGPGGWEQGYLGEIFAGPFNFEFFKFFVEQVVKSIEQAHSNLKPGSIGFGAVNLPQFTRNRLVKAAGRIDPEFSFLLAQQENEKKIALGSYSAHATVLSSKNMRYSGDYPGYWQRRIARQLPGKALFLAGGVGSHAPKVSGKHADNARFLGETTADSVLAHLDAIETSRKLPLFALGLRVSLPELHVRISDNWRIAPWLARKLVRETETYLQLIRIGDILIIGTPCDFSGEIAARIKAEVFRQGFRAMITSFNGSYIGYVIPSKYYHFDAYESRTMSFFGPAIGDYIPDLIRRMIDVALAE